MDQQRDGGRLINARAMMAEETGSRLPRTMKKKLYASLLPRIQLEFAPSAVQQSFFLLFVNYFPSEDREIAVHVLDCCSPARASTVERLAIAQPKFIFYRFSMFLLREVAVRRECAE